MGERAVRLHDDALRFAEFARLTLLKERVHFDLIDRRRQAGVREQFFKVLAAGIDLEADAFVEVFGTDDAATGVQSFREQGPGQARFTGR